MLHFLVKQAELSETKVGKLSCRSTTTASMLRGFPLSAYWHKALPHTCLDKAAFSDSFVGSVRHVDIIMASCYQQDAADQEWLLESVELNAVDSISLKWIFRL